ncbi:MAG: 2OG-Fe(II) oxygenase [Bryobacteraceae bacterium]
MLSLLHPAVRTGAGEISRQFASAQPFRHVVIEPFLDPDFCRELIESFPRFETRYARNERGEPGGKAVVPNITSLGPPYVRFDQLMRDPEFLKLTGEITGIPGLLYDKDYAGGGTHENIDGQELDSHVDFNYHPARPWHRRLNLIVFLNPEWDEQWGGCLELLRNPSVTSGDGKRTVLPLANRAVIFETTESSWHGFPRIQVPPGRNLSRKSIAVYFYTKQRPADQIAPSHGTLYFQRPLPERIRPGYTLQEQDMSELALLLDRRDTHIRFLYERERKFSNLIAAITNSVSFKIGRGLTWPARALKSLAGRKDP